jgi:hypothetical protein
VQRLQCYRSPEGCILGFVDDGHPTGA